MQKNFLIILFILPLLSLAQSNGYEIKGNLKGLKDSSLVFLQNVEGITIAQDYAFKGKFSLKGNLDDPGYFQLGIIGINDQTELFLGNNTVSVEGDVSKIKSLSIKGSPFHDQYNTFVAFFKPLNETLVVLSNGINKEKNDTKKRDSLIKQFNLNKDKLKTFTDKFIKDNSQSLVSSFILYQFRKLYEGEELSDRYKLLKPSAKKTVFAMEIEKELNTVEVGKVGTMAADFVQNDVNEKPVSLSSFKGKYLLVDFWASWCRPCRAENPNVVNAYNKFKDKNFTVLGVSLDRDKESWVKAIKDDNLPWTHVSDLKFWSNAVAQLYRIQSIPSNLLIDPSGKIIGKDLRGEDLLSRLNKLLK